MSWTPSFRGFFSSCTRQPSCHGCWAHSKEARWQRPGRSSQAVPALRAPPRPWPPGNAWGRQPLAPMPACPTCHSPREGRPPPTSLFAGSSQSWERLNAKQQRTLEGGEAVRCWQGLSPPRRGCGSPGPPHRSSHLIWTQPGLRRKDQGWYHLSTAGRLEQSTSSHRCSTCSLRAGGGVPAQRPAPPAPPLPPAAEVSSPPPARGPQLATPLLAGQEAQYALSSSREPPPPGQRSLDAAPLPGGKSRNPMLSLAPRGWHPSACSQVPGEL